MAYANVDAGAYTETAGLNPYIFDLSAEKESTVGSCNSATINPDAKNKSAAIKITLTNTLYALLGPHYLKDYDKLDGIEPGVFNHREIFTGDYLIKPYGLKKITTV